MFLIHNLVLGFRNKAARIYPKYPVQANLFSTSEMSMKSMKSMFKEV